eukprot:sb/3462215/
MKIVKPSWVASTNPLFSCDVHPDGSKFLTAGQNDTNGQIGVWYLAPVAREKVERSGSTKKIATLENHEGCVNCVRWSNSGKLFASASDDKSVIVWTAVRYEGSATESYRCKYTLRGHGGDVLDVAWSPDDKYLASTSIDNSVIVWDASNFPERATTIRGHQGMVKGVVWDPIGKYLATQSTDRTLRVWRVGDWVEETKISDPFVKCGGTTSFLRIGWSPDGQYVVSSHAMNNEGPVAKIIERDEWKARMDFVGHRRAIESVRFNPNLFYYDKMPASCVAIAGRDNSVSVWLTCLKRPLFVLHDLFKSSVLDMSWTPDGYGLVVCSHDGSMAYLGLSPRELGRTMSLQQVGALKRSLYGSLEKVRIIENPDLVSSEEDVEEMDTADDQPPPPPPPNGVFSNGNLEKFNNRFTTPASSTTPEPAISSSQGPATSSVAEKQVETKTKDGKRRIMPVTLKEVTTNPPPEQVPPPAKRRVSITPVSNKTPTNTIDLRSTPAKLSTIIPPLPQAPILPPTPSRQFLLLGDTRVEVQNKEVKFTGPLKTWVAPVEGAVTTLSGDGGVVAVGCEDGSIYTFHPKTGRLILPILNTGHAITHSCVTGKHLAVVTNRPSLYLWNVEDPPKCVVKDESLGSFVSTKRSIVTLTISPEGDVRVGLSDSSEYQYSRELSCWAVIGHTHLDGSWGRDLNNGKSNNTKQPPPKRTYLQTVQQLHQRIRVAELGGRGSEGKQWLTSLVRYLSLNKDEEKLREVLQGVISSSKPLIHGAERLELMGSLLKVVGSTCQRVYSEFKQQLDWAASRE